MRINFKSLGFSSTIGYVAGTEELWNAYWPMRGIAVHHTAGFFQTYGDSAGHQHSSGSVCGVMHFADWCASLAAHLLENPEKGFTVPLRGIPDSHVEFYKSMQYRDGKDQYYNPRELKVSTASSRQYDKRWKPVTVSMIGSPESALQLYLEDGQHDAGGWSQLCLLDKYNAAYRFFGAGYWGFDWQEWRDALGQCATEAFEALLAVRNAREAAGDARRHLDSVERYHEYHRKKLAQKLAQAQGEALAAAA
ncbi:MAG: hypothetical protein ACYDC1_17410 [Limisphaerales bacterium]